MGGTAGKQDAGRRRRGRPGGQDVVHQQDMPPGDRPAKTEGAADIVLPLSPVEAALARRRPNPLQQVGRMLEPAGPGNGARQQRRLIETTGKQPAAMQRHRQDEIACRDQRGTRPDHHRRQGRGKLGPVTSLEGEHELAACIVIDEGAATLPPAWPAGHAGGAQTVPADRQNLLERIAAGAAAGFGDEGKARPAIGAQQPMTGKPDTAAMAARRQDGIEPAAEGGSQACDNVGGSHHHEHAKRLAVARNLFSGGFSRGEGRGETVNRIHVIGAGLAGLAAAVRLAAAGCKVSLHEAAGRAGGRCRSFHDATLDAVIDNGNHLMLSGNRDLDAYLDAIGAADRLVGPERAIFPFLDLESGRRWTLDLGAGRLPMWIFDSARRVPGTRARDWLASVRRLLLADRDATTEVLAAGTGPLWRCFWEPLVVAALNTQPDRASIRLLRPVLFETFGRGGAQCRPRVARDSLADSLIDPALETLAGLGATIRFHTRVTGFEFAGDRLAALQLGEQRIALGAGDAAVLAAPAWIARGLLPGLETPDEGEAIVNVHYRLGAAPFAEPVRLIGLVGGLAHWVFVRGSIASVTISAADRVAARRNDSIAAACWREVTQALDLPAADPPAWRVIKEKRATFAATPQALARRPGPATRWRNLALAGDWTATGLPATIESAVRSGHKAADLLQSRGGRRP